MADVLAGTWPYLIQCAEAELLNNSWYHSHLPDGVGFTLGAKFATAWRQCASGREGLRQIDFVLRTERVELIADKRVGPGHPLRVDKRPRSGAPQCPRIVRFRKRNIAIGSRDCRIARMLHLFGIRSLPGNVLIGTCQLNSVHSVHRTAELQIRIGPRRNEGRDGARMRSGFTRVRVQGSEFRTCIASRLRLQPVSNSRV